MAANSNELVVVDKRHSMTTTEPSSIENSIFAAAQRGDLALVEKLMDLKDRHERTEARKSFVEAMSAFKAETITVVKDKLNNQYNSKYVSLGNLVSTVTPYLSKNNLSVRWDIDQTTSIKVTCIITHAMGHSEQVSMICPPDKSGSKNPIQEIKSAITYAKACTFESICGLASTDSNVDDDGNSSSKMSDLTERLEWIANARNLEELDKIFRAAYKSASEAQDQKAQQTIVKAKDSRRKELA